MCPQTDTADYRWGCLLTRYDVLGKSSSVWHFRKCCIIINTHCLTPTSWDEISQATLVAIWWWMRRKFLQQLMRKIREARASSVWIPFVPQLARIQPAKQTDFFTTRFGDYQQSICACMGKCCMGWLLNIVWFVASTSFWFLCARGKDSVMLT